MIIKHFISLLLAFLLLVTPLQGWASSEVACKMECCKNISNEKDCCCKDLKEQSDKHQSNDKCGDHSCKCITAINCIFIDTASDIENIKTTSLKIRFKYVQLFVESVYLSFKLPPKIG